MWVMVMFYLPALTKAERKAAAGFRKELLNMGFEMAQFSVYLRFCGSDAQVSTLASKVQQVLPRSGQVSILTFTDKQYERIISFANRQHQAQKRPPDQLEMF